MERVSIRALLIALIATASLVPIGMLMSGQPSGYTLVCTPVQYYAAAPWMNVKNVYAKVDGGKLYWYIELGGAMPTTQGSSTTFYVYMDTDRSASTGDRRNGMGADYYLYFYLHGDNSSAYIQLARYNATSDQYKWATANCGITRGKGLNYVEAWVDQQAVGYSAQGLRFSIDEDAENLGVPATSGTYVLGTRQRTIAVDGSAEDWEGIFAAVTLPARSTVPAELECSAIHIANDNDNLYFRLDPRGTPTRSLEAGTLHRYVGLYLDTDNSNSTGKRSLGGADYEVDVSFTTSGSAGGDIWLYKYFGDGDNWDFRYVSVEDSHVGNDNVFEFKVPLEKLGLGTSGRVNFYWGSSAWYLWDSFPRPVDYLTYPPSSATTGGELGIMKLFGSEAVFLGVVAALMIVEAVLIVVAMRMGKKPETPPPP
jgi:hypothetical protein